MNSFELDLVTILAGIVIVVAIIIAARVILGGPGPMKFCPQCGSELVRWREDGIIVRGSTLSANWYGCPQYRDLPWPQKRDHYAQWTEGTDASPFDAHTGKPR